MKIKTVGDLKKALDGIDNDFTIELMQSKIFRGHLLNHHYYELHFGDVGYSDKVVVLSIGDEI